MAANGRQRFEPLSPGEFLDLATGRSEQVDRLRVPAQLAAATMFSYPGKGPITVYMVSDGNRVRLSEGGGLLRFLEGQGMDLALDAVISKTVFHAIKGTAGAGMGGGQLFLDTTPGEVAKDLWRFLQIVVEAIGLRHSKYKDALVKLSSAGQRLEPSAFS